MTDISFENLTGSHLISSLDESEAKDAEQNQQRIQSFQNSQPVPLVNPQGKMLLPPTGGKGCYDPTYANPRQVLRILKRREVKRRLGFSGRLKRRRQEKAENELKAQNPDKDQHRDSDKTYSLRGESDKC